MELADVVNSRNGKNYFSSRFVFKFRGDLTLTSFPVLDSSQSYHGADLLSFL